MSRFSHPIGLIVVAWAVIGIGCRQDASPPSKPNPSASIDHLTGTWQAWLDSPGGRLPFQLEFSTDASQLTVWVINGPERVEVPKVSWQDDQLLLEFVHYNSTIRARLDSEGRRLDGQWKKVQGLKQWSALDFHAEKSSPQTETPPAQTSGPSIAGRWRIEFEGDDDAAIGLLQQQDSGRLTGTIMTTVGDYRYLAGSMEGNQMRLSVFDGAHAFLFLAQLRPDNTLVGDFWSRDRWHQTWTARRDEQAQLPDPMKLTQPVESVDLSSLRFPDLTGKQHALDDPKFAGRARIIEIFGTWCPNCNDATRLLVELDERYRDQGLSILALAFEMTGDHQQDAAQVQRYIDYHKIRYPVLIAGHADKARASEAFPLIDRIRSYPTTLFIDSKGEIQEIFTGFNGPATGPAYQALRNQFETLIQRMLAEETPSDTR